MINDIPKSLFDAVVSVLNLSSVNESTKTLDHVAQSYVQMLTESDAINIENFSKKWKDVGVEHFVFHRKHNNTIHLSTIKVPVEHQRKGIGTQFMQDLTQHADKLGATITLSPSTDFGASKSRLIKFYKNHDFVENKGRNKDYTLSDTMYRLPQAPKNFVDIHPEKLSQEPSRTMPSVKSVTVPRKSLNDNFHRWFGNSKVAENGNPIEVYHGTPDITGIHTSGSFKNSPEGIFFTNDQKTANSYADVRRAFDYQNAKAGIVSAHLKIENPYVHDHRGKEWQGTREIIEKAKSLGHDGVIINNVIDRYNTPGTKKVKPSTVYVVFNPNQIKHSRMNSGEYKNIDKIFE